MSTGMHLAIAMFVALTVPGLYGAYRAWRARKPWTARMLAAGAVLTLAGEVLMLFADGGAVWAIFAGMPFAIGVVAASTWLDHQAEDEREPEPVFTRILPPRTGARTKRTRRLARGAPASFSVNSKIPVNAPAPTPRLSGDT